MILKRAEGIDAAPVPEVDIKAQSPWSPLRGMFNVSLICFSNGGLCAFGLGPSSDIWLLAVGYWLWHYLALVSLVCAQRVTSRHFFFILHAVLLRARTHTHTHTHTHTLPAFS